MKIRRYYRKINTNHSQSSINKDFDTIDLFYRNLRNSIKVHNIEVVHEPIADAFNTRLDVILFQNRYRTCFILRGIISELNMNNVPAAIPLVRTFLELTIQLGYLTSQIINNENYEELLKGPICSVFLGNKNEKAGPFAIGKVESINILTMIEHAEKLLNHNESEENNKISSIYADLSNQSHPNYSSNMLYSSLNESGKLEVLADIGEDMVTIKGLAYDFYMSPLIMIIALYNIFFEKLSTDPKISRKLF